MERREDGHRVGPDMTRVGDGLFQMFSGMAKVVQETRPKEYEQLGFVEIHKMAAAFAASLNGGVDNHPELLQPLGSARELMHLLNELGCGTKPR